MTEIDDAIGKVENLYRVLMGHEAPQLTTPHAPIPAERDPVEHVQEQMDRLNQLLSQQPAARSNATPPTWVPPLCIWESPEEIVFCVDLPGVTRQGLEVSVQANAIVVTGRRQTPVTNPATKLELRRTEQPLGMFRRVVPLPPYVKSEQMNAALVDGVLTLRLPREAQTASSSRNVPIA